MKKYFIRILLILMVAISGCGKGETYLLTEKDGKFYVVDNTDLYSMMNPKLFTGTQHVYMDPRLNAKEPLLLKMQIKDGLPHGVSESYFYNGQLDSKGKFKNGKRIGKFVHYYEDGQLKEESNFKDGEFDGKFISYYNNGNIQIKAEYDNGNMKSLEEFNKQGNLVLAKTLDGEIKYYDSGRIKSYSDGPIGANYEDIPIDFNALNEQYKDIETIVNEAIENKSKDYIWQLQEGIEPQVYGLLLSKNLTKNERTELLELQEKVKGLIKKQMEFINQ